MNTSLPASCSARRLKMTVASVGLGLSVALAGTVDLMASPAAPATHQWAAQNVDYISTDAGYALDLGFPVLVPSWVPSPFGGPPSIDAGGGYYGLYWMNVGSPTFLHITGQVGGGLPAGSPRPQQRTLHQRQRDGVQRDPRRDPSLRCRLVDHGWRALQG